MFLSNKESYISYMICKSIKKDGYQCRYNALPGSSVCGIHQYKANGGGKNDPKPKPTVKPVKKPAAKPAKKPAKKPAAKPAAKPAKKPAAKPAKKPAKKPVARPSAKPVPVRVKATMVPGVKTAAPKLPRGEVGRRTRAWLGRKPTSKAERVAAMSQCGAKCFLVPKEHKYPVCSMGSCDYDCDALRAQRNMTHLIYNRHTVSEEAKQKALRARNKANELGIAHCEWV